jgi:hypothetical protein
MFAESIVIVQSQNLSAQLLHMKVASSSLPLPLPIICLEVFMTWESTVRFCKRVQSIHTLFHFHYAQSWYYFCNPASKAEP